MLRPWLVVLALASGACNSQTVVDLEIVGGESLALDYMQVRIGDRSSLANPVSTLEVWIPGEMAGAEAKLEVWGLQGPQQIAYGMTAVTPVEGERVHARIELAPVGCDAWCEAGAVACASEGGVDGTVICTQQPDGCMAWGPLVACPTSAPFCSSGECAAQCTDECTTGAQICNGPAARLTCGSFDGDSCLDWSPSTACGNGESCSDGVCSDGGGGTCGTAGSGCDDGNACTTMDRCDGNACSGEPIVCDDPQPAPTCTSQAMLRSYADLGSCNSGTCSYAQLDSPCPWGCNGGLCAPADLGSGFDATCLIDATNGPECFGSGAGSLTAEYIPNADSLSVSSGNVACVIRPLGSLECWGEGGTGITWPSPTGTFSQVAVGYWAACAVRTTGVLECWGSNAYGQLSEPQGVFRKVGVGADHACAIRADYTLACWGLGAPTVAGKFINLSIYEQNGCAIRTDGTLACWGFPTSGLQPPAATKFMAVSVGDGFGCGVKLDGNVTCWGAGGDGQTTPASGTFVEVAAGTRHVCGVRDDGTLACWGKQI